MVQQVLNSGSDAAAGWLGPKTGSQDSQGCSPRLTSPGTSAPRSGKLCLVADRLSLHRDGSDPTRSQRVRTGEVPNPASATDTDETALARAAMLGQTWAQRQIWCRFAPMVYALLRRTLGARHDPEDLLQEVFLRVFGRLHTLENPSALRSFVYSFSVRVVSEELRRVRVRSRLAALFLPRTEEPSTPHVDFESRELLRRIDGVLDRMNDRVRTVFVLRRFEGIALAEIASRLELSLATVKRDLDKASEFIVRSIRQDPRLHAGLAAAETCAKDKP
jgi:RNA polymerase sigma-70 factor (ECF subfamily)